MRKLLLSVLLLLAAAPLSAGETAIPDRFDSIKAGEWMMMRDVSGGDREGERNKISVVKVDGDVLLMRREHFAADGSLIETKDREMSIAGMRGHFAGIQSIAKSIEPGFITVKNQEIPVVVVAFADEDESGAGEKRDFIIWISEKLPVNGVAKTWCSDAEFPQAEVIDYGF